MNINTFGEHPRSFFSMLLPSTLATCQHMNFVSGTPPKTSDKQIQPNSFLDVATKTPEKISLKQRYVGWTIDHSTSTAALAHDDAEHSTQIKLMRAPVGAIYEAWWPRKPIREPQLVIGGCCLWDGRWQIEFAKRAKKATPARRRLSHQQEKEDAFRRLRQGQIPTRIYVPCSLGDYHRKLIKWQASHIRRLHVAQVLYHIPTDEYHLYISTVEKELGYQCPQMHEKLDEFAEKVEKELKTQLGDHDVELRFIRPMKEWKARTPLESYLQPYVRIKDLCSDPSRVIGLEDLRESRLAREASAKSRIEIPVLGAVLGIPDPFAIKTLRDEHFTIVELA